MTAQHKLKLDISNFNNKVETIYTKSATTENTLVAEIYSNGSAAELPSADNIIILSNSNAYKQSSGFPKKAKSVSGNTVTFDLSDTYEKGWTVLSIRISSDNKYYETQSFQIFCEESPTGDESTLELSIAATQYINNLTSSFISQTSTDIKNILEDIDTALNNLLDDTYED